MAYWIIVVDDDPSNIKVAGHILSSHGMRVTALKSGVKLLSYIRENGTPDIVLLDILMPEMDGFETLTGLRALEKELRIPETPVVFLTGDDDRDSEMRGFQLGVSDFIRKPFDPDILIQRITNIINTNQKLITIEEEASRDGLTGFLNKESSRNRISEMCRTMTGSLCVVDLDSFKLVNDIYGHEMGDRVLEAFASVVKRNMTPDSVCGRIGGDEFIIFCTGMQRESDISDFSRRLNEGIVTSAKELLGDDFNIPLGASIGAVSVPARGTDYDELFHMADRALYVSKDMGRHRYTLFKSEHMDALTDDPTTRLDLKTVSKLLEERSIPNSVMWMGKEAFGNVYRYMMRYLERYDIPAVKVLFTLEYSVPGLEGEVKERIVDTFREVIQTSLRNSDIMVQTGGNQFFLLLPELSPDNMDSVLDRMRLAWEKNTFSDRARLICEYEQVE